MPNSAKIVPEALRPRQKGYEGRGDVAAGPVIPYERPIWASLCDAGARPRSASQGGCTSFDAGRTTAFELPSRGNGEETR
jgi:hypothetical protein